MSERCCHLCVYATRLSGRCQWITNCLTGWAGSLVCINHAESPGQVREVFPTSVCPNFRRRVEPPVWTTPPEPTDKDIRYIGLTRGKWAIVSAADYEWLSQWKWHASPRGPAGEFYAKRRERGRNVWMHREIMQAPPEMVVDHIDGNSLNNVRDNLRLCTAKENSRNRRPNRNSKTGFKGVWRDKRTGRWYATIRYQKKNIYLGAFDTAEEAARAYDRKALELFGEFARLNFPLEHTNADAGPPSRK